MNEHTPDAPDTPTGPYPTFPIAAPEIVAPLARYFRGISDVIASAVDANNGVIVWDALASVFAELRPGAPLTDLIGAAIIGDKIGDGTNSLTNTQWVIAASVLAARASESIDRPDNPIQAVRNRLADDLRAANDRLQARRGTLENGS